MKTKTTTRKPSNLLLGMFIQASIPIPKKEEPAPAVMTWEEYQAAHTEWMVSESELSRAYGEYLSEAAPIDAQDEVLKVLEQVKA